MSDNSIDVCSRQHRATSNGPEDQTNSPPNDTHEYEERATSPTECGDSSHQSKHSHVEIKENDEGDLLNPENKDQEGLNKEATCQLLGYKEKDIFADEEIQTLDEIISNLGLGRWNYLFFLITSLCEYN